MATRVMSSTQTGRKYALSNEWYNTVEAAHFLGISRGTLYNWMSQGIAPAYYQQRRQKRFKKADLVNFLEGNRVEPRR